MQIPLSLTRHLAERRCVLFVGAGLSAAAGLPTWGGLLDEVLKELESNSDANAPELRRLWEAKKYLEVADHCADAKSAQLRSTLAGRVRGATEPIPAIHRILCTLPFAGIVTTNYDKLVERACWEAGLAPKVHPHSSKDAFGTLLFDRAFFILKAHGDIDEPDTIVLSTKSYRELIHANPAFNAVMSAILLNFSILFVGYSLNDPDFRLLIERQITDFKGNTPIRYALMDGIGPVEAQILQRNAGIQVIDYPKGQHAEVLTFFQLLQQNVQQQDAKKRDVTPISLPQVPAPAAASGVPAAVTRSAAAGSRRSRREPADAKITILSAQDEPRKTDVDALKSLPLFSPTLHLRLSAGTIEATFEKGAGFRAISTALRTGAVLLGAATGNPFLMAGGALGGMLPEAAAPLVSRVPLPDWPALADAVGSAVSGSSLEAIGAVGTELRKCLSAEMLTALEAAGSNQQLGIVAEPPLETVPWEWLDVGGKPLCIARPVFRHAPSAITHMPLPPSVLIIGDPHGNLPDAAAEAHAVARLCGSRISLLMGPAATFGKVVDLLEVGLFDVLHFAGHAWVDDGQAHLYLAESTGIGARELRSFISRNPPAIVFLNSHYTAFVPIGVSVHGVNNVTVADNRTIPTNVFGFLDMATSAGVGAFIGCMGSPRDDSARELGIAFHRELAAGASASVALWHARLKVTESRPDDPTPLLYVGSGVAGLRAIAAASEPAS